MLVEIVYILGWFMAGMMCGLNFYLYGPTSWSIINVIVAAIFMLLSARSAAERP